MMHSSVTNFEPTRMDFPQIALLSLVQGVTEFLPISSSGHLILTPLLFGEELQSLAFDVATHLGTLVAVMLYFRRDLVAIMTEMFASLTTRRRLTPQARLGWMIGLATLPILVLGWPLKLLLDALRADPTLAALTIAATSIGFGLLLGLADWRGKRRLGEPDIDWKMALAIGIFQAIAIVPGISRSGITITAGLLLGLTRAASARFSFLLSIPTIVLAVLFETKSLLLAPEPADWLALGLGALLSGVFAWLAIHYFLRLIERIGMLPFVLYRLVLGGVILALFWPV